VDDNGGGGADVEAVLELDVGLFQDMAELCSLCVCACVRA